jgi:hypothetical protein
MIKHPLCFQQYFPCVGHEQGESFFSGGKIGLVINLIAATAACTDLLASSALIDVVTSNVISVSYSSAHGYNGMTDQVKKPAASLF